MSDEMRHDIWIMGNFDKALIPPPYTIDEYLLYAQNNPLRFIEYCSVVIDKDGLIYENIWGHQDTARRVLGLTGFEHTELSPIEYMCSNHSVILVDYGKQLGSKQSMITNACKESYNALVKNGIIQDCIEYMPE